MAEAVRESAPSPAVLEERRGGVTTLTLNRPHKLNALNDVLGRALVEALNHVAEDSAVRAVVITGAGRGFCTGGDLNMLREARERGDESVLEAVLRAGKR